MSRVVVQVVTLVGMEVLRLSAADGCYRLIRTGVALGFVSLF